MTSHHLPGTTRFLSSIVLVVLFVVPATRAQTTTALTGVYNGTYSCGQGTTKLKLSLRVSAAGDISGLFTFYLPPGTQQQGYTYSLHGQYNPQTAKIALTPMRWETEHPANFVMVGMNGTFGSNKLAGTITGGPCSTFSVQRSQTESAQIAHVMAAQKLVVAPLAAPVHGQAPTSARSALPAPAMRSQPAPVSAAAAPGNASINTFCFSADPEQPVVYFSDVFELPDSGSAAENVMEYKLAKDDFQIYLLDNYKYADDKNLVDCGYMNTATTAAAMTAKKHSMAAQALAAKKQVVETGWKHTEPPSADDPIGSGGFITPPDR